MKHRLSTEATFEDKLIEMLDQADSIVASIYFHAISETNAERTKVSTELNDAIETIYKAVSTIRNAKMKLKELQCKEEV